MAGSRPERRVLVTGAAGFVGRHALPALIRRGYVVHAVSRTQQPAVSGVIWHRGDLLAPGMPAALIATIRPSHLLHLAWETAHGAFWSAPANVDWAAVTLCLARAFADHGGARMVGVGSCAEYDWRRRDSSPWHEADPAEPATLYGAAKLGVARTLLELAAGAAGPSTAWARLFLLYGHGEAPQRLVASMIADLARGGSAHCRSAALTRDLLDVRDAGEALAALLDSPIRGIVNVASGRPALLGDVARSLAVLAGRPEAVSLADQAAPHEPRSMVADIKRLVGEVGFSPRIELEHGLQDALTMARCSHPGPCSAIER